MNILAAVLLAQALVAPDPGVIFRPSVIKTDEKPVVVETSAKIAADNGLFRRVETTIVFTNPNSRVFEGELEFPVPDGATVCGYELEVNGSLVPGVVVPKEEARVAFENEKRKGVDPGIVEHVKGKIWKTRIYPLMPNTPRKATVAYIVSDDLKGEGPGKEVFEKFGDEVFVGRYLGEAAAKTESKADRLRKAGKAMIYWDASMSRKDNFKADRNLLECLPENGDYTLVVFRNVIEEPLRFSNRMDLLKAVDSLVYDGGTCLGKVLKSADCQLPAACFVFSDEYKEPKPRQISVRKLDKDEKPDTEPKEGMLLAAAWAAFRVEDLADDAQSHKDELVEIGRRYGVASSVTSMIVLESLEQYKTYKIEPPKCMSFYDEWKKWRAAEDDPIAAEKAKADHRAELLRYWEERVKWWNDPVPPKKTPKSGLFDGVARASSLMAASRSSAPMAEDAAEPVTVEESAAMEPEGLAPSGARSLVSGFGGRVAKAKSGSEAAANVADVKLAAWNPDMPYLKAMSSVANGCAYAEYLKHREVYGNSPAFYLDCAGWFFKAKDLKLGARIISNLSEMKLEDVGLWRTMAWRLREAGLRDEAEEAFRHVLKLRPEEPQSKRDLALVLTERGKSAWNTDKRRFHDDIMEAVVLLQDAAFTPPARRSGSRGNDFQTSVLALEELNGLRMWWQSMKIRSPFPWRDEDAAFCRDMPCELRIMLSWDTDETDVDLHVLEPDGEEAFYGHRRTSSGGFVSEDVTTGYGPEEYLRKTADKGVYKILANYFASHRQQLTGAATISATVYTGWGTDKETRQIMSLRLDKPKDKHPIGEIEIK